MVDMKRWIMGSQDDLLIYHFNQIIQVNDITLSNALFRVDNKDISLALLGSGEDQKLKVLKNVSKKRSIMIQDDIDFYEMTYSKSDCDTKVYPIVKTKNGLF